MPREAMLCSIARKSRPRWLIALVVVLSMSWAAAGSFAQDDGATVSVDVQGAALIRGGNQASAREAAVREALGNSVRQVLGERFAAGTESRVARGVDRLLATPERYVETYSVLQEGVEGNTYTVQLRVEVVPVLLAGDLAEAGFRADPKSAAPRNEISVRVRGVRDFDRFVRMRRELSALPGVRRVLPREVAPGEIRLEVETADTPAVLAGHMESSGRFVVRDGGTAAGGLDVEFRP